MRTLSLTLPVLVLAAVCAGCAGTRGGGGTSTMGASAGQQQVMCRDAAWVTSTSECGIHGGVERVVGSPGAK